MNEVSADFFCPVKKCFEFACEASFKKSTIPEYKKEYQEIEDRFVAASLQLKSAASLQFSNFYIDVPKYSQYLAKDADAWLMFSDGWFG